MLRRHCRHNIRYAPFFLSTSLLITCPTSERKPGHSDKLFQYCSTDINALVQRQIRVRGSRYLILDLSSYPLFTQFDGERDLRTPQDFSGGATVSRTDDMPDDDDDDGDPDDSPVLQYLRHDSLKGKGDPESGQVAGSKREVPEVRSTLVSQPLPTYPCRSTTGHISTTRDHNPPHHRLSLSQLTAIQSLMHQAAGLSVLRHLIPGNLQIHESVSRWMFTRVQHHHLSRARSPLDLIPISHIHRVLSFRALRLQRHFSQRSHTNQDTFRATARTFRQQRSVAPAVAYTCQHHFRHLRRQDLARVLLLYLCCHLMGRLGIHHVSHNLISGRTPMTCSRTCLDPRAEAG